MAGNANPPRRSAGRHQMARALWYVKPGHAELRAARVEAPGPDEACVKALYSGISRGTERLVASGLVGPTEWDRMRCPHQDGAFPFPVKYGYCATGIVEDGPRELLGRTVFCLHPHQDRFVVKARMLTPVPDAIPARRATLAANMETALNAMWDAGAGPGDRITVVGAGVVGLMVASLAARIPGSDVTVIDVAEERRAIVESLGATFQRSPAHDPGGTGRGPAATAASAGTAADIVFHTSASAPGLETAIACAGFEGTIVEMSWYGDRTIETRLGGAFHSQRLKLISSQVGHVSAGRRPRWDYGRRMQKAVSLLDLAALDQLVAEEIPFDEAAKRMPEILAPGAPGLAPVIGYRR